jgi:taurine dioxygenase
MFSVEKLPGGHDFGAVVENLTRSDMDDPAARKALYDLWIDRGLLVFRGVEGGREAQFQLSGVFGECELHPIKQHRLPEREEITALIYKPGEGILMRVDGEERGAVQPWHSDLIYVDRINRGGLLRAIQLPSHGGATGFIDQIGLYAALPADLQRKIDGLNVIYHYDPRVKKFGRPLDLVSLGSMKSSNPDDYPLVAHPMVFTQAETGRKVLNVSPWFAVAIEGMESPEGDALLAEVIAFCEDESRAYHHRWRPDDMLLWDNWRMLHNAEGVPKAESRRVERITLKGDYNLGRVVRAPLRTEGEHAYGQY